MNLLVEELVAGRDLWPGPTFLTNIPGADTLDEREARLLWLLFELEFTQSEAAAVLHRLGLTGLAQQGTSRLLLRALRKILAAAK